MSLSREEILKVAKLSKLSLSDEEIIKFDKELNDILNYINMFNEVDTASVEPLVYMNEEVNNFRENEVRESIEVEKVLLNAHIHEENAIVVPKVIGE